MVRKAVIPAAGLGTRFLPATKATPKEMLPVVDRPAIQYLVEEAAAAGFDDILLITGRNKRALEDHFDRAYELEHALEQRHDSARIDEIRHSAELAHIHYVRQGEPRGLGHAVLQAADHVGDEPFAVLLGDDLIDERDPLLTRMIEVREQHGGSVIALMRMPRESLPLYGVAAVEATDAPDLLHVLDLVEKPTLGAAPSDYAIIGRYVLDPAVFGVLEVTAPGRAGEIQLTDALRVLATMPAEAGGGVHGVVFEGRRYDTGDKLGWLQATVRLAVRRDDLGANFRSWLTEFVSADFPDGAE